MNTLTRFKTDCAYLLKMVEDNAPTFKVSSCDLYKFRGRFEAFYLCFITCIKMQIFSYKLQLISRKTYYPP